MRRTKQDAEITKSRIMTNGVSLFLEHGFSATTLDQIAVAANVTRGAIHHHFTDKIGLVRAHSEIEIAELFDLLEELFQEDVTTLQKVKNVIQGVVTNYYENVSFRRFIELTWFKMEYSQLSFLRESKAEPTIYFIKEFEKLIKIAQDQKVIRPEVNSSDIAITITNMINGLYRLGYISPDIMPSKKEAMRPFNSYLSLLLNK